MRKRHGWPLTIKHEVFLLSFLILALVLLLFTGVFLKLLYDDNIENAKNFLRESNSQIVLYTEAMFHENASIISILARDDQIIYAESEDSDEILKIFNDISKNNTNITYIYAGYIDGRLVINNYTPPPGFDSTTRPWYLGASAADGVSMLVYADAISGEWLFNQSIKLVNDSGNMIGVVAIDSSNDNISQKLSTKYKYKTQRSFITDLYGAILIHPNEEEINMSLRYKMDRSAWNAIVNGTNNYIEYTKDDLVSMAYLERIPQTDFIVVTAIDAKEVTEPIIRSILTLFLLATVISMFIGFLFSRILMYRFARPVVELSRRIRDIVSDKPAAEGEIRFANAEIRGIAEGIEVIVKKMALREKQRQAAEYLSFHDSLTGLYNRRFFTEELRNMDIKQNYPLCIMCCDVNGLKLVNDVFGHAAGDKLIISVASCLEKNCRSCDIPARTGGDEFAVILPRTTSAEAESIISRISTDFFGTYMNGAYMSASLGYAVKTEESQPIEGVLQTADEMMYNRKLKESAEMKKRTVENFISQAERDLLAKPLTDKESELLNLFAEELCPDAIWLLKESYRLRKIGLCKLTFSEGYNSETRNTRHTETAYRILSYIETYRDIGEIILHYMERWDGSGWPGGLSGREIPLFSRILAIAEGFTDCSSFGQLLKNKGILFDPDLIDLLAEKYDVTETPVKHI